MRQQRGVALITAILIVALVTAIGVSMASKQQLDIRRSANLLHNDKAYLFALGAEDFARNMLEWDLTKNTTKVDHPNEDWAQTVSVPVEGVMLSGELQDQQGLFNLNSLLTADGETNTLMLERFKRLLRAVGVEEAIAQAVLDWQDEDINPRHNGGAEDDHYMLQQPPYRAANDRFVSVSELLLVNGVSHEAYTLLAPHVTALDDISLGININTATAAVLACLSDTLTLADGEALIEAREEEGFDKIDEFIKQPLLSNHKLDKNFLTVQSSYFMLNAVAEFEDNQAKLNSLLFRADDGKVSVLMRSRGVY